MLIISRNKAASCTDSELHSFLRVLFNDLANDACDESSQRCCHASIEAVRAEQAQPRRGI
ncbi:hypothetical protein [Hyphomicrobium sp.]|uniref:hypothetical protein n=1 Tax=Hyphomicrobium sp. TaxID=82 RepID=UPI003F71E4E5